MTLICFASQKGSPGATAAALAVAAALQPGPGRRKLLVEADGSGGAVALRYGLAAEPGLVTLAAALRAGLEPEGLWHHAQELPGGLPVVVCPDGADQVHAALAACGARLGAHLAALVDVDVICDVGRLGPGSPAADLVGQANALLMVARPTAEQLQPAARYMHGLRSEVRNLGWVLVGEKPYGPAEVEATFGFPVVGVIADDRRSVTAIEHGAMSKRLRRHPFIRSAATLAEILAEWLSPVTRPASEQAVSGVISPEGATGSEVGAAESCDGASLPSSAVSQESPSADVPAVDAPAADAPAVDSPAGPPSPDPARPAPAPLFAAGPRTYGTPRGPVEVAPTKPHRPSPGYAWAPASPTPPAPPGRGARSGS